MRIVELEAIVNFGGGEIEVTAVEINEDIAKVYQQFFPQDKVIVGDAHQYLLEHFSEFDFIWASPPCPSHSRVRIYSSVARGQSEPIYPDMKLYEEIIFLKYYFKGKWVVENVISYYEPLIKPKEIQRHYFWSNFNISQNSFIAPDNIGDGNNEDRQDKLGFDISNISIEDKTKLLRNCVDPQLGLHVFECAFKKKQLSLF
jgi:DNA (cytosine-5)-methyltransferase 1